MLNKLLNDFKEKMIAEDFSDNTIKIIFLMQASGEGRAMQELFVNGTKKLIFQMTQKK